MSKVKYYYDPETLSYRPIEITNKKRISDIYTIHSRFFRIWLELSAYLIKF